MNTDDELEALLPTSSVDVGCSAGFELLHRYVEEELAGGAPEATYPGVAAHITSCPACHEDYVGLREAGLTYGDARPDRP